MIRSRGARSAAAPALLALLAGCGVLERGSQPTVTVTAPVPSSAVESSTTASSDAAPLMLSSDGVGPVALGTTLTDGEQLLRALLGPADSVDLGGCPLGAAAPDTVTLQWGGLYVDFVAVPNEAASDIPFEEAVLERWSLIAADERFLVGEGPGVGGTGAELLASGAEEGSASLDGLATLELDGVTYSLDSQDTSGTVDAVALDPQSCE